MKKSVTPKDINGAYNPTFTDGVFNSTTTITSATAAFVAADVGRGIQGPGIPAGATIVTVPTGTSITISPSTTATGSNRSFTILGRKRTTMQVPILTLPPASIVFSTNTRTRIPLVAGGDVMKADAVTNGTTTVTSATFAFVAADVGRSIKATADFASGTVINSVTNGTTIVLNKPAKTSGAGKQLTIINRNRLTSATAQIKTANHTYGTAKSQLVADNQDLYATPQLENVATTTAVFLEIITAGANLDEVNEGKVDAYLNYQVPI